MYAPTPHGMALYPYQEEGSIFASTRAAALIADDMGLGKTVQAIACANQIGATRILVVCPATLKSNWRREMNTWLAAPLSIGIVQGNDVPDTDVIICNYDVIHRHNKAFAKIDWDLVVFDEAHYLKNPEARRTQASLHSGFKGRRLFLTGTPIENKPVELWPILWSLDRYAWGTLHEFGKRYCAAREMVIIKRMAPKDWGAYRRWCFANQVPEAPRLSAKAWDAFVLACRPTQPKYQRCWTYDGAENLAELNAKLKPFMLRRLKSEVLKDLPAKTRQVIELPANGLSATLKHEAAALKDAVIKLQADQVEAAFEELAKVRHETALAKLPQCIQFIHDALESSQKIIVFAHHRDVCEKLRDAISGSVVLYGGMSDEEKDKVIKSFKTDAGCRVFIGSISAAGVGLTLTEAHHVIFVEGDWTPSKLSQAEDRCHRIGQRSAVLVQHLVLEGSLDARVLRKVIRKQDIISATLDAPSDTQDWAKDLLALEPSA